MSGGNDNDYNDNDLDYPATREHDTDILIGVILVTIIILFIVDPVISSGQTLLLLLGITILTVIIQAFRILRKLTAIVIVASAILYPVIMLVWANTIH